MHLAFAVCKACDLVSDALSTLVPVCEQFAVIGEVVVTICCEGSLCSNHCSIHFDIPASVNIVWGLQMLAECLQTSFSAQFHTCPPKALLFFFGNAPC